MAGTGEEEMRRQTELLFQFQPLTVVLFVYSVQLEGLKCKPNLKIGAEAQRGTFSVSPHARDRLGLTSYTAFL